MAKLITRIRSFLTTPFGVVLEAIFYAVLLLLVMAFFTGNGQFIYEAY
jgi:hypothetical protein